MEILWYKNISLKIDKQNPSIPIWLDMISILNYKKNKKIFILNNY